MCIRDRMGNHLSLIMKRSKMEPIQQMFGSITENRVLELRDLFSNYPSISVDAIDGDENTLLSVAAKMGDPEVVSLLLQKGANPNKANKNGDTPLHFALSFNNLEIADMLITAGALQNVRNNQNKTPWEMAS
eukprot:TRINITY_DN6113_c0_g1_i1.p1 TRINITY_DN6113_c0_g1~~TRINITY_DN6113_c0_g1_i1.p1  ORF type:complete len:132 (+),score=18.08 TRINITY_DN6113_c0_g1_i1:64-459(+)